MGKIAFVFAGQGAQSPGMGKDVYDAVPAAREVFEKADAVRPETSGQCFEADAAELMQTKNTQPCVYTVDLAMAAALEADALAADADSLEADADALDALLEPLEHATMNSANIAANTAASSALNLVFFIVSLPLCLPTVKRETVRPLTPFRHC